MKVRIIKKLGYLIAGLVLFASCEYDFIVPEVVVLPDEISFKDDIVPVFDNSCNITGCHTEGHFAVDLTPDNAYQDLFAKNMIDIDNPELSVLYSKLIETGGTHDGRSTPTQQELILKWIVDGALNN